MDVLEKKRFNLYNMIAILMGVGAIVIFIPVLLFVLVPMAVICWEEVLLWVASAYDKTRK